MPRSRIEVSASIASGVERLMRLRGLSGPGSRLTRRLETGGRSH